MEVIKDEMSDDDLSDIGEHGDGDNNDGSSSSSNNGNGMNNSCESVKDCCNENNNSECSLPCVVSNDGIIIDMENHFDHTDEGSMEIDLVVRDECSETHGSAEEASEPSRCYSAQLVKDEDKSARKRAHSAEPFKYKRPDPVICAESVEIECLMHRAQFFLARACQENIKMAMKTSLWTTHPFVEKLLAEAYRRAPVVILVFLARNADHFSGFAQMCSEAQYKGQPAIRWVDFKGGGNIKLHWITKCSLLLTATDHIKNPFNKEKVIYAAADGCEIQRAAGQRLCSLFPFDVSVDLKVLKTKIRQNTRKSTNELPSLLETEISYSEFRHAKRNLPIKKTLKELCNEKRPSPVPLTSNRHESRSRKCHAAVYNPIRPLPLMDVAVSFPLSSCTRLSSSLWRKRHLSPLRLSSKRHSLDRDHRDNSRSSDHKKRQNLERLSAHRYDFHSSQSSSKINWRGSLHGERETVRRHPNRHRYC